MCTSILNRTIVKSTHSILRNGCPFQIPRPHPVYFAIGQIRFRYNKRSSTKDDDFEDEESEDLYREEQGSKVITGYMASLRADLVLKTGLGMARNKIETIFYESKIRLNGGKLMKKSQKVNVGDELDVIKDSPSSNDTMISVSRVVVLSAKEHDDEDKLVVKMRRFKTLTIKNSDP